MNVVSRALNQGSARRVRAGGASGMSFAIVGSRGFPSTYGGYETLVRYLARHLVAEGHNVTVYCRDTRDGRRVWYDEGVRCVTTRGRDTKNISTLSFGASSCTDAALRRFDAVLVLNIANGFWMPLLRAARIPFAVNTDGLEWERGKWSRIGQFVFRNGARLSARFAPVLVCDSEALAEVWQRDFGRTSEFIPYGGEICDPLGDTRIRDLELSPGGYALAVARLVPENNVELLIDAIEELGDDAPMAVVVGSANFDNPITKRLQALEQQGKILWLGHVDDQNLLAELWQNAGVYVHGHSVGGTNPALLQALGAGAPTIALDTVFNREVLPFDEHLFPHDPTALAQRIQDLIGSDSLRNEMIVRGREAVSGRYRWADVCERYTDLLVDLARTRATRID